MYRNVQRGEVVIKNRLLINRLDGAAPEILLFKVHLLNRPLDSEERTFLACSVLRLAASLKLRPSFNLGQIGRVFSAL
jgi:hypothetical protein